MAVVDIKDEKLRAESVPAASPSAPEPEFHVTFVDTALPPGLAFQTNSGEAAGTEERGSEGIPIQQGFSRTRG